MSRNVTGNSRSRDRGKRGRGGRRSRLKKGLAARAKALDGYEKVGLSLKKTDSVADVTLAKLKKSREEAEAKAVALFQRTKDGMAATQRIAADIDKEDTASEAKTNPTHTLCKKCGKPFVWMRTPTDVWIPIEPDSYDGGELYVKGKHEPHFSHCRPEREKDYSPEALQFDECEIGGYVRVNDSLFLRLPPWPVTVTRTT